MNNFGNEQFALLYKDTGNCFYFQYTPSLIGRDRKKCHLILNHHSVSKIHCALFLSKHRLCICDFGSLNGVFVNKQRVKFKRLIEGDDIQIGKYQFQFIGIFNNSNAEQQFQETKEKTIDNYSNSEYRLDDLAISPPLAKVSNPSLNTDDINLVELDDFDSETSDPLEDIYPDVSLDEGVSSYDLNPSTKLSTEPPKLKRQKYGQSDGHKKNRKGNGIALFSISDLKENPLLRRVFYTVGLIVIFWGLKEIWYSGNSDNEIYNALQNKLAIVQSHRESGAGPLEWEALANDSHSEFQPMISYLEKNASAENRAQQELLRAARDCLPKVFLESRQEISSHEKLLEEHLEIARMILNNEYIEENNYDSKFPVKPPGG
ncbi:FHA domain-containing protein [uncultured Gimesia sp.]|uniref:FHA domain-containing protein n=1 Tax=uncultured Gimesia sp. TaxID=1678688 RepID=UPI00263790DA|nr:FHA domain-containing protein [uncultured Gimesia sp.]